MFAQAAETEPLARAGPRHRRGLSRAGLRRPRRALLGPGRARRDLRPQPRDSGIAEIARAALEAVGYQTRDLMAAMDADLAGGDDPAAGVRVDGGMVGNDWLCQFLADILALPVERPAVTETTALGAAYLAGLEAGLYPSLDAIAASWQCERRFEPQMDQDRRETLYAGWRDAVRRTLSTT